MMQIRRMYMKRYLTSLLVITVVFTALVFVTWVPFSKAGIGNLETCQFYCDEVVVCACSGNITGNLRETSCRADCPPPEEIGCNQVDCKCASRCLPPTKKGKVIEEGVQWLRYPLVAVPLPPCPADCS
jgi:hypothetical protein